MQDVVFLALLPSSRAAIVQVAMRVQCAYLFAISVLAVHVSAQMNSSPPNPDYFLPISSVGSNVRPPIMPMDSSKGSYTNAEAPDCATTAIKSPKLSFISDVIALKSTFGRKSLRKISHSKDDTVTKSLTWIICKINWIWLIQDSGVAVPFYGCQDNGATIQQLSFWANDQWMRGVGVSYEPLPPSCMFRRHPSFYNSSQHELLAWTRCVQINALYRRSRKQDCRNWGHKLCKSKTNKCACRQNCQMVGRSSLDVWMWQVIRQVRLGAAISQASAIPTLPSRGGKESHLSACGLGQMYRGRLINVLEPSVSTLLLWVVGTLVLEALQSQHWELEEVRSIISYLLECALSVTMSPLGSQPWPGTPSLKYPVLAGQVVWFWNDNHTSERDKDWCWPGNSMWDCPKGRWDSAYNYRGRLHSQGCWSSLALM